MADWFVPHNRWVNKPEYEDAVLRVMRSGHVAQGPQVAAFEDELAARFRPDGAACCVSSGTAALRLALILLGSDDVWIPTYACSALWFAHLPGVGRKHLKPPPQLRDCQPDTLNTPDATIVVHTYGVLCPVGPDQIEDFTHAAGAPGAGSHGAFSVVSFGATKPLGVGGGGALLGPKDAIERARGMRDYETWPTSDPAFNYQCSDLHAAIGRVRLRRLDEDNSQRAAIAYAYLGASRGATAIVTTGSRTYYRYVIRTANPECARRHFAYYGVETIVPLRTDELLHRRNGERPSRFPNAEAAAQSTLSLPIWPGMTDEQVERVHRALFTLDDKAVA